MSRNTPGNNSHEKSRPSAEVNAMPRRVFLVEDASNFLQAVAIKSFPNIAQPEKPFMPVESVIVATETPAPAQVTSETASNVINFAEKRVTHQDELKQAREAAALQLVMKVHNDIAA